MYNTHALVRSTYVCYFHAIVAPVFVEDDMKKTLKMPARNIVGGFTYMYIEQPQEQNPEIEAVLPCKSTEKPLSTNG